VAGAAAVADSAVMFAGANDFEASAVRTSGGVGAAAEAEAAAVAVVVAEADCPRRAVAAAMARSTTDDAAPDGPVVAAGAALSGDVVAGSVVGVDVTVDDAWVARARIRPSRVSPFVPIAGVVDATVLPSP